MPKEHRKKFFRHSSTFYRKLKRDLSSVSAKHVISEEQKLNDFKHKQCVPEMEESYLDNTNDAYIPHLAKEISNPEEVELEQSATSLNQDIKIWALSHRITHSAVNNLLKILKNHQMQVPCDSRILMGTPSSVSIIAMANWQFWYRGLRNSLLPCFSNFNSALNIKTMSLVFNIDGLPPFKSSPLQFWPILYKIEEFPFLNPLVVAVYCGEMKPPLKEFLDEFVTELNEMLVDLN